MKVSYSIVFTRLTLSQVEDPTASLTHIFNLPFFGKKVDKSLIFLSIEETQSSSSSSMNYKADQVFWLHPGV